MQLIRFLHNFINLKVSSSERGISLLETLVASTLGAFITLMCSNSAVVWKGVIASDTVRTSVNQNLRGAAEVLISDGRLAGENLSEIFPAFELINQGNEKQELVIRRNLVSSILNVCTDIRAGSTKGKIYIANSNTVSGCIRSEEKTKYNIWQKYRLKQPDKVVSAYIYDADTKKGEFFSYVSEGITSNNYWISASGGAWGANYAANSSWILVLEEWRYRKENKMLQIVQNGDYDEPFNLAYGVTDFRVKVSMQDGRELTSFGVDDEWTKIVRVDAELKAEDLALDKRINKSIKTYFFPRNILSH